MTQTSTDRLLRRTQRRLFAVTLMLLALLVVGVGAATLVVGTSALDANVDAALEAAVTAQVVGRSGASCPRAMTTASIATMGPAVADTVLLVLDAAGRPVQVRGTLPPGLPVADAVAASTDGDDWRTVEAGGSDLRLLHGAPAPRRRDRGLRPGRLRPRRSTRHRRAASAIAVLTIGGLGLLAAALITLLVVSRALVPIREGFEAQRRFVADASHELRTPAALIRANAEVLEREGTRRGGRPGARRRHHRRGRPARRARRRHAPARRLGRHVDGDHACRPRRGRGRTRHGPGCERARRRARRAAGGRRAGARTRQRRSREARAAPAHPGGQRHRPLARRRDGAGRRPNLRSGRDGRRSTTMGRASPRRIGRACSSPSLASRARLGTAREAPGSASRSRDGSPMRTGRGSRPAPRRVVAPGSP